jgi:hypothetical protein
LCWREGPELGASGERLELRQLLIEDNGAGSARTRRGNKQANREQQYQSGQIAQANENTHKDDLYLNMTSIVI